jgi:hypothetical protein
MSETAELIQGDVFASQTYERSANITRLAQALVKAQAAMKPAPKSSDNPFFKSRYSDLATIWEVAQQPLADNGLAVLQPISSTQDGKGAIVTTILVHTSGEFVTSTFTVFPRPERERDRNTKQIIPGSEPFVTPQSLGSAITYGRRYALAAMLGIVSDDDDGEGAEGRGKTNGHHAPAQRPAPTYQRPPVAQVDQPQPDEPPAWTPEQHTARQKQLSEQQQQPAETPRANPANADKPISEAQAKRLFAIAKEHGWENDELREFIGSCGYEHSKDILRKDYDGIIEVLQNH